ncbi:hypothetical protein TNCV_122151 [Trichonephila clavipes]|nr:hypothetical protein TNCV_122151 [Trichonephila clavipes]
MLPAGRYQIETHENHRDLDFFVNRFKNRSFSERIAILIADPTDYEVLSANRFQYSRNVKPVKIRRHFVEIYGENVKSDETVWQLNDRCINVHDDAQSG